MHRYFMLIILALFAISFTGCSVSEKVGLTSSGDGETSDPSDDTGDPDGNLDPPTFPDDPGTTDPIVLADLTYLPGTAAIGETITIYGRWKAYNGAKFSACGYSDVNGTVSFYQNGVELTPGQPLTNGDVTAKIWAIGREYCYFTVVWFVDGDPNPKNSQVVFAIDGIGANG